MKMKLLRLLPVVLFMLCQSLGAQIQMKYWAMPPYKINFTAATPTTSLLPTLNSPTGIVFDGLDYYLTDELTHSISKISSTGDVQFFAGNGMPGAWDGDAAYSQFNRPKGIARHAATFNLYIADAGNNKIRKINSGIVSTIAGSGTAGSLDGTGTAAQFNNPTGIAVDGSGNIYVADAGSNKIRKITSAGVVTTIAGSGVAGTANGTGTAAQFNNPTGIVVDGSGNLFVVDNNTNRIRKITPAGVVTTFAGSGVAGPANGTRNSSSI